jgi:SMODS and SLOG-associating 2TM effector domain family 4
MPQEADMFQLSLVDHIRLSFGSVATSYRAHARAAERLTARAWQSRVLLVIIVALVTGASLVALTGLRPFQIATAALAALALLAFTIVLSLDFESRAYAHRACAAQLWLLCEKYRALLAEVHDGLIDLPAVTRRRDDLMREVHVVYEHALPADREAYRIAREALGGGDSVPSDQDIDRLLPASLRQQPVGSGLKA